MLQSCIKASASQQSLNDKVLEWMFALELCNSAAGKLWSFLRQKIGLCPLLSRKPRIQITNSLADSHDMNCIYVMQDPDQSQSKTDVVFFAFSDTSKKAVRVLVQLTLKKHDRAKIASSFQGMLGQKPVLLEQEELLDYRLFVGPRSTVQGTSIYDSNYKNNRCIVFNAYSGLEHAFELPVEIICDPHATNAAIDELIKKAEELKEFGLAARLAGEVDEKLYISDKRPRASSGEANEFTDISIAQRPILLVRIWCFYVACFKIVCLFPGKYG